MKPTRSSRRNRASAARATPALLAGTSSEFLGRRALPHVLRRRAVVLLLGPKGVGKSSVAQRLAGAHAMRIDGKGWQRAQVRRVRVGAWADELLVAPALIIDGPGYVDRRPSVAIALCELIAQRVAAGHKTLLCQAADEGSLDPVMACLAPGSSVVIGLRFPKGKRGRLRFARRVCDTMHIERIAARGTDLIDPWGYDAVIHFLAAWRKQARLESPPRLTPTPDPTPRRQNQPPVG